MLDFVKMSIDNKKDIDKYFCVYGEGSCQHSFVTSYCLSVKYDNYYCEKESVLYTLRNGLCDDKYRIYLFPMCDWNDNSKLKNIIDNILNDAHGHNKKVSFNSITTKAKDRIKELYGDLFVIEENRNLYEYIYAIDDLAYLKGSQYYNKRNEVKTFFKRYDGKITIKKMEDEDLENIKKLGKFWLDEDENRNLNEQLIIENKALDIALNEYDKLGIIGTVIYVEKDIAGFIIGTALNYEMIDAMIEKGNIKYKGIYRVLNNEFAKQCCDNYKYVNLEEDLGVEGLRNMKLLYHPSHLIKKFVAREV